MTDWPTPTHGVRIDEDGVRWADGSLLPWVEIDRFVQIDDEHEWRHVHVIDRAGRNRRIPGLGANFVGVIRERAAEVAQLNEVAVARQRPSELVFPVRLRSTMWQRVGSAACALVMVGLAVMNVVVLVTSRELGEAPLVALIMVAMAVTLAATGAWLLHQGWRWATITADEVTVRTPFRRSRVPLAKVFAFQLYRAGAGRRACGILYWVDEPGRRSARLPLPGSDPEYRLPALDAYVRNTFI